MPIVYQPFEFQVILGFSGHASLSVRVHAQTREQAWSRVCQMHPRAVEARPARPERCEQIHIQSADRQKNTK
jgi:hypothetical protein